MSNELIPSGGGSPQPIVTYESPKPTGSLLDQAVDATNRRLEYLKGHEAKFGHLFKFLLFGGGTLWFMFNWRLVRDFVDGVVDIQTKAIYGGILAFVMWLMWLVFSNKTFQYTIAMMADRTIEKFHRLMVARDAQGSARFSINKLRKRLREGEEAKSKVGGVYEATHREAERAHQAAVNAFSQAKGLAEEQARRKQGKGNPRIKLTDSQLERTIAKAKADIRREYEFWQEQAGNADKLSARYAAIQEVLDSAAVEIGNMEADLQKAITRLELSQAQEGAMQASDEVANSRERSVFDQSMQIIAQQADMFDGRTRMILERLDPTIQTYRANQAGATIADEDFFAALANDSSFGVKSGTQQKLVETGKPVINEFEAFLGNPTREKVPVRVDQSNPARSSSGTENNFDDLFGGGR